MTLPELVRTSVEGYVDLVDQGQRQELAGSQFVNKLAVRTVELTFDEIAGAYCKEEDPRSVCGPVNGSSQTTRPESL
jgi:hypothetical protein